MAKSENPLSELFVGTSETAVRTRRAVESGRARKIGPRLYTGNMKDDPGEIIRRELWRAISLLAPGSVISARTALEMKPAEDGTIFLTTGSSPRTIALPGLTARFLKGPGPLPGDIPLLDIFIASRPRAILEALRPSRARKTVSRGLPRKSIEALLERDLASAGEGRLNQIRDDARKLASSLDAEEEFAILDQTIGALLGTRTATLTSPAAKARAGGEPYDTGRLEVFHALHSALATTAIKVRPDPDFNSVEFHNLSFYDAYFSNYIEGTKFELEEAKDVVFYGKIPERRPADAHDILGTYQLVSNRAFMTRGIQQMAGFDHFLDVLVDANREILRGRRDKNPGEYKTQPNVAGSTVFVPPELVRGTLRRGFELALGLEGAFARAAMVMFLITEVHPFEDGNGRVARALMNAELVTRAERRILIPTVYRDDYVGALRAVTRQRRSEPFIKMLDFAQEYTARIDFASYDRAREVLRATNAFEEPEDGIILNLPDPPTFPERLA
jgi:hypothetical protein